MPRSIETVINGDDDCVFTIVSDTGRSVCQNLQRTRT
jgi:hypothetical protein